MKSLIAIIFVLSFAFIVDSSALNLRDSMATVVRVARQAEVTVTNNNDEEQPAEDFNQISDITTEMSSIETMTQIPESSSGESVDAKPIDQELTQPINEQSDEILQNGTQYVIKITVVKPWNDDYLNQLSESFAKLNQLSSELMDFYENKEQSEELNVTEFIIVNVQPIPDSLEQIYVTWLMQSKTTIDGEKFKTALSSQLMIYNRIYTVEATSDGFVMNFITPQEAGEMLLNHGREWCSRKFLTDFDFNLIKFSINFSDGKFYGIKFAAYNKIHTGKLLSIK